MGANIRRAIKQNALCDTCVQLDTRNERTQGLTITEWNGFAGVHPKRKFESSGVGPYRMYQYTKGKWLDYYTKHHEETRHSRGSQSQLRRCWWPDTFQHLDIYQEHRD